MNKTLAFARRNAIALLALFVALGGSAYAASQVGSKGIKDDSVRSVDIKDGGVKQQDLAAGAAREATASATLLASTGSNGKGGDPELINNEGFSGFTHPDEGLYILNLADESVDGQCDVLTSPTIGMEKAPAAAVAGDPDNDEIFLQVGKTNGDPVNIGDTAFGYNGVAIRAYCGS